MGRKARIWNMSRSRLLQAAPTGVIEKSLGVSVFLITLSVRANASSQIDKDRIINNMEGGKALHTLS